MLLAVAVILGASTALFWLWSVRVDPAALSQDYLHRLGTTSDHVRMQPIPSRHEVIMDSIDVDDLGPLISGHLPRPFGSGTAQVQGWYDTSSRTIHVTGRLARASAASPIPAFRGIFVHALRHEYGHAFLDEWLRRRTGSAKQIAEFSDPPELQSTNGLPGPLIAVVAEFRTQPSDLYGNPYAMSNFNEYFAESYARFLEGKPIAPQMERFLSAHAQMR